MKAELCPVKEHIECRRCDALYIAKEANPTCTTEELIVEAGKIMNFIESGLTHGAGVVNLVSIDATNKK